MKRKKPSREELLSSCSDTGPEDGADPKIFFRPGPDRKTSRKALQLCGHVAQVIGQILSWETGDDLLAELAVESVLPAPSTARLVVTLSAPASVAVEEALERLHRQAAKLRLEVAKSVCRRRAPELTFRIFTRPIP